MKKKRLSIVDIARTLKISKTTISFILTGKAREKRISEELVAKVVKYVEEVGYKPNSIARSLRTGKSYIIGLMVEDISHPFFASIARLIEDKVNKNGYKIIYASTDNDTKKTRELISMMRDRHVDGYILTPPAGVEVEIRELIDDNLPVVMFDRYLPDVKADYVIVDNLFSSYTATKHLIKQGYKNVIFITFNSLLTQMHDRLAGYKKAMDEHNLSCNILELDYNHDMDIIVEQLNVLLEKQNDIDSIFFGTTRICICGLQVLSNMGKKVPHDVAVISFDDHVVYKLHSPSITSIAQPIEEIANNIISVLLHKLDKHNNKQEFHTITLKNKLIIRNSTSPRA
jgi:LacI family transcriptional regulator